MKKSVLIFIALLLNVVASAQEYLVFETFKGRNRRALLPGVDMSTNKVELVAGDTTLNLFNWVISPQENALSHGQEIAQKLYHTNTVLIVAVPLELGQQKPLKLTEKELKSLTIVSTDSLLARTLVDLEKHLQPRTKLMPPLKTLQYGLIIKDGGDYLLIEGKVLVAQFRLDYGPTYFPEEYRNGTLSVNPENKIYDFAYIDKLEKEFRKKKVPHAWLGKIVNRVYLSQITKDSRFESPVFHFWEYPSEDVVSSLLSLEKLHEFNLGLGSFEYVYDVGIINATLDTFLKKQIRFQQKPSFVIKHINGLNVEDFTKSAYYK